MKEVDKEPIADIKPIENSSGSVNKAKIEAILKKRRARTATEEVKTTGISWKVIWNEIIYSKEILTEAEKSKLKFSDKTWVPNLILNFKNQDISNSDYKVKYEDLNYTIAKDSQKVICWTKKTDTSESQKHSLFYSYLKQSDHTKAAAAINWFSDNSSYPCFAWTVDYWKWFKSWLIWFKYDDDKSYEALDFIIKIFYTKDSMLHVSHRNISWERILYFLETWSQVPAENIYEKYWPKDISTNSKKIIELLKTKINSMTEEDMKIIIDKI